MESSELASPVQPADSLRRRTVLAVAFLLSGAAGLVLEVLWFRQAGLAFGNGIWASSLVLSSFMGGLALGNAVAARWGPRFSRPLLGYALAEVVVAVSGPLLVAILPSVSGFLHPLLERLDGKPFLLNALRFGVSFALLAVPATAMGLTFPLVVRAANRPGSPLRTTLGRLYGWNTLGAVCGAALTELLFVPRLGMNGSALFAGSLNLVAAACGAGLAVSTAALPRGTDAKAGDGGRTSLPPLFAAALAGCLLLALEVVWFRSLVHFVLASSLTFALMLATVLAGIALGGFVSSARLRARGRPDAATVFLLCGTVTAGTWMLFPHLLSILGGRSQGDPLETALLGGVLMLPTSLLSGAVFALVGDIVGRTSTDPARATGRLSLWNTCGALLGSPVAAFVLLPYLGVDGSILLVSCLYGFAALLTLGQDPAAPARPATRFVSVAGFGCAILLLGLRPPGEILLARALAQFGGPPEIRPVLVNEGVTETVVVLESRFLDEPNFHRLVTNGFSMSGTWYPWARYMKSFVYLPVALHPAPREALLICFGVGATAQALVETPGMTRIDVVDISANVLDASRAIYRDGRANPLDDPRVHVRVEDGRYVLSSTDRSWDIITAEPPPPQAAGVVNLYTREYFRLVRNRLSPGGITTHWLPVHSLPKSDALAVVRAFCDVFEDCSLWNGTGLDWVLLGSRDGLRPASELQVAAGWSGSGGRERARLGFERPEQLGAAFLADSGTLAELTRGVDPVVDDYPRRLSERLPGPDDTGFFLRLQSASAARQRFLASPFSRDVWPSSLGGRTAAAFSGQDVINRVFSGYAGQPDRRLEDLETVLAKSDLRTLVFWILGTDPVEEEIALRAQARGVRGEQVERQLAAGEMARRHYSAAAARYGRLASTGTPDRHWRELEAVALRLAGAPPARMGPAR